MSINRLDFPTVPDPVDGDWAKTIELISKAYKNLYNPVQFVGTVIPQGATFQIGGIIYYTNSDTTITGTVSAYVKLVPNVGDLGATCDAIFVADLTGVTWNKIYNGYYDTAESLVIFDEVRAVLTGAIVGLHTKFGELWNNNAGQSLKSTDSPTFAALTAATMLTNVTFNQRIVPRNNPVAQSSATLTANGTLLIPRGLLNLRTTITFSGGAVGSYIIGTFEILVNGQWLRVASSAANVGTTVQYTALVAGILSTGTNVRLLAIFDDNGIAAGSVKAYWDEF